ncbi:TetR family transcriptional regulator [Paenibacillus sp. KS1]|uniref:TetR/AcrR family transcriptional regulator n=1 Tax=Paenibacillus sp. KS1 TaxID=1849249 RepID=UPI00080661DF|nr:TetR/AcrR family transcriptional regulator [Paenibacillus sp. KS1]OBY80778.1 TetR family transcriptional regulator [Paenibacillus sp. KS1]
MPDNSRPQTDPRIRRTRQLIKDAFVDMLQEMEIEKMSISGIAERATISRVTFYLHYRDIPDMLNKMADEMIEDLQRAMNSNPDHPSSPEENDWLKLVGMLEHIAENAPFYKITLGSRRTPIFTDRLLKMLTEIITAKFENKETDSSNNRTAIQKDIAIWHGSSALIGTIVGWLRNDMPYTPVFLAKQLYLLHSQDL